jgi:acyl carrier protein
VRKLMDVAVAEGPVLEALFESLKSVVPNAKLEGADTKLLGTDAVVDSVGFLGFLMSAESALGNTVDLSALLIEAGDVPSEESPFRTVGSLANYIEQVRSY